MQYYVDSISILTTLFSEKKLYPSSSRYVTLVVFRIILLSITFTVFFFLFYSPFSLSKKIFRGNSTLIHKSLYNTSMSRKTSLTELVFDEWKRERRERKWFHSFIAQKTRSFEKAETHRSMECDEIYFCFFVQNFIEKCALFDWSYLRFLFNNIRNICFNTFIF